MSDTKAIGGLSLTTSLQTLVTNMAADAKVRTYQLDFVNIDGVNPADITQCIWIDSGASNAQRPILPVNTTIRPGGDGARSREWILNPGDSIRVSASAAGDIYATVLQVYEEPAT
ncbi:hypothetical protein [Aureimonas sp. Leaf324]|jgi:hypothetical protein|uniref:hypothetical protein n=1 Tax=Aureimonas sp. Leaf324 TaxID=1736336 RepID=UPI0006F282F5|nr:hypothetical protein [Aureimonas sp. Leaf324]KQQ85077.1 hypothetical protein ASF65_19875 [Aureimonas sp. Leaf324]